LLALVINNVFIFLYFSSFSLNNSFSFPCSIIVTDVTFLPHCYPDLAKNIVFSLYRYQTWTTYRMGWMDFNQRKIIVRDNINDNAKQMKDFVEPFPDCSAKSEMMRLIEHIISILHLVCQSFCFLQIDNYNSLERTKSRTTLLFFCRIWYNKLSILQ
jgi:hypothetical protein